MKSKISIILLNYNTPQITYNCIKSIINNTQGINFEIILVDNGSKEESRIFFDENLLGFDKLKIIYLKENIGFGAGNNVGFENSNGEYILFLNNDTLFYENSLSNLLKEYKKLSIKNKIGFIQPRLYLDVTKLSIQKTCSKIPKIFNIIQENFKIMQYIQYKDFINFRYLNWDRNSSRFVDVVCGAAMFCKRDFFKSIGKFDKRFFLYFEENDVCKRAISLGYKNYYTIKTSIIHFHNQSPRPNSSKKLIYIKSFFKYITKVYS